jgi:anti-anti-sigma factor
MNAMHNDALPVLDVTHLMDTLEIRLDGDLDIATLPALRERLDEALELTPRRLVLDFAACGYLDAQAINVLLDAHKALWRTQGRLVLRACNPATLRLLALAGVLNVFELERDAEGAALSA